MQYPNIRSRAGLVVLFFALIISLVSAVPIPATDSELSSLRSNPSLRGQNHIQLDTAKISTLPTAARTPTYRHISTDLDYQLVRRSIFDKIKHAFQKVGNGIKKGFQKVGEGIKTGVQKVGNFVKTNGAKIAKFGLKVVQAGGEALGKVAGFIPGVGKPIQAAIHGISTAAGIGSDKIHAKLSPQLQKGMNVMNKADKVMNFIPRRRDLSEEEVFQQRDISGAYDYFEERDDIALENREESYFVATKRDIYDQD